VEALGAQVAPAWVERFSVQEPWSCSTIVSLAIPDMAVSAVLVAKAAPARRCKSKRTVDAAGQEEPEGPLKERLSATSALRSWWEIAFLQIQPKLVMAGAVVLRVVLLASEPEEVERMPGTALEEGCTRQANYLPLTIRFTLTAALVARVVNPGLLISSAVRVAAAMRGQE